MMPRLFARQTLILMLLLLCLLTGISFAQVKDFVSVDAARYSQVIAPESIAAGFTVNVTSSVYTAEDVDPNTPGIQLPTQLGGISVSVNNRLAGLFFVSPNQINYAVPADTETDGPATVVVTDAQGTVLAQGTLNVVNTMLSIFTSNSAGTGAPAALSTPDGVSYAAVGNGDGSSNVVSAGQYLVLFGTGIRGELADIKCFIGGTEAPVLYAGLQGGFLALYQVNIQIPASLANQGQVELYLTDSNTFSNTVTIDLGGNPTAPAGSPVVTALSASQAAAGQIVTLTGSGFATSVDQATVRIGNVYGQVVASSATEMSFIVPYGAVTGRIVAGNASGERQSNSTLTITTSISGTILATDGSPLSGLPVSVASANAYTTTDSTGRFLLTGLPAGINRIDLDATGTAYVSESFSIVVTPDRDNVISYPITLLEDFGTDLVFGAAAESAATTTSIPVLEHDGLRLEIPGAITFPDGTNQGRLRLGRVSRDRRLPVPLPAGIYPSVLAFIAPPGTTFGADGKDQATLYFPNVDQKPAGTKFDLYALDRKVTPSAFVKKGEATVNEAGDMVVAQGLIDVATLWFIGLPVDNTQLTKVIGRVLDASSQPVSGARVFVRGRSAATDVSGNFAISSVRAENGEQLNVEVFYFTPSGVPLRSAKLGTAVVPGETNVGDIQLPAEPPLVLLLRPQEVKIEAGQSAEMKVILSRPLSADVTINLAKVDGVNVTFNPASVTIEAGKTEAGFSVSGSVAGRAVIEASPAAAVDGLSTDQVRNGRALVMVLSAAPVLNGITPGSGEPGSVIVINGSNFAEEGKYNQVFFRQGDRLFVVDPHDVSLISTPNGVTGLKCKVPGVKPGEYDVFVMKWQEGTRSVASNALKFTVTEAPAPVLTAINPAEGKPGTEFTLTGTGFDPEPKHHGVFFKVGDRIFPVDPGTLKVMTSANAAGVTGVNVTGLVGQVPRMPAGDAEVFVVVFRDNIISPPSNKLAFKVLGEPAPQITAINPVEGLPGSSFEITGSGFAEGRTFVAFVQGEHKFFLDANNTSVSANSIKGIVPRITPGEYQIIVVVNNDNIQGTLSNGMNFKVLAPPAPKLTALRPAEGQPGTEVTILGEGFAGDGSVNIVYLKQGDKQVDTRNVKPVQGGIAFIVPQLPLGEYAVSVAVIRDGAKSENSNALPFNVIAPPPPPAPVLSGVDPAEGAPGTMFAIRGQGFALNPEANHITFKQGSEFFNVDPQAVRISPDGAALTGVVPRMPAGEAEFCVTIVRDGLKSESSNGLKFTVLALPVPELTAITPAEGKIGDKFVITGKGFSPDVWRNHIFFRLDDLWIHVDEESVVLTDNGLEAAVPEVPTTNYKVFVIVEHTTGRSDPSNELDFNVTGPQPAAAPQLTEITPTQGKPGDSFVIKGTGFAPEIENNFVVFKLGNRMEDVAVEDGLKFTEGGLEGFVPWLPAGDVQVFVVSKINGSMSLPSNRLGFGVLQSPPPPAPQLAAITPTEGKPGDRFVIKGAGFGREPWMNQVIFKQGDQWMQADNRMLQFSAEGLTGLVPQLPVGDFEVFVVIQINEFRSEPSNVLAFKVLAPEPPPAPVLNSITPTEGQPGAEFTISGTGFAPEAARHGVFFKQGDHVINVDVKQLSLMPNGLTGRVPVVPAGDYEVFVVVFGDGELKSNPSNGLKFTVLAPPGPAAPKLTAISPGEGHPGTQFTISGEGFAPEAAQHGVFFKQGDRIVNVDVKQLNISPNGLYGPVPPVPPGDYEVFVVIFGADGTKGAPSNALPFKVLPLPAPVLESVTPGEGSVGTRIVITGQGFSPIPQNNHIVFKFGDLFIRADEDANQISADGKLSGIVPELPSGDLEIMVVVEKDGLWTAPSNGLAFKVSGPVPAPAPVLTEIIPAEGKPGDKFVVKGTGFAALLANNYVVFKQGDLLERVEPNEMKFVEGGIECLVPFLRPGDVQVFVVSIKDGSMSLPSNRLLFKVLELPPPPAPVLSAIAPGDGAEPGQQFTIAGTGFGRINQVVFKQGEQIIHLDPNMIQFTANGLTGIVPNLPAGQAEVWVRVGFDIWTSPDSNHLQFVIKPKAN